MVAVMATRGEQAPELAGFVDVMRARVTPVPLTDEERASLVDVVGTGGGGPLTFNISSGAALVAAAAGAKVAKHGNRAVTSRCGAADVLEALGVPIDAEPELAAECLRETGFMFLFAPLYHPAMKMLGPLRKTLGYQDDFQFGGPLSNPAGARTQVVGVLAPSKVLLVGRTLAALGAKRAFVVHGMDGIDELTTTGESVVARVEESETGESTLKASRVTPEMAGLPHGDARAVCGRRCGDQCFAAFRCADGNSWSEAGHCSVQCCGWTGGGGVGGGFEAGRGDGRGGDRLRPGCCDTGKTAAVWRKALDSAVDPSWSASVKIRARFAGCCVLRNEGDSSMSIRTGIAVFAMLVGAGSALAQQPGQAQLKIDATNRTLTVSAENTVTVEPEVAILHVGFETLPTDAKGAYAAGTATSNAIIGALKQAGVPESSIRSEWQHLNSVYDKPHKFTLAAAMDGSGKAGAGGGDSGRGHNRRCHE